MSIREAARRVHSDLKAVHVDVTALLNSGVQQRNQDGSIEFPFGTVKIELVLQAALERVSLKKRYSEVPITTPSIGTNQSHN